MKEDGGPLSPEKRSGWRVHSFLAHLASGLDPVPYFERVALLQVDPDLTVHLPHSLFSVPVGLYYIAWRLFACCGELPLEGLPPVAELPMDVLLVRSSVCAFPRADHISHLEGVSPSAWQATPCKRVGKLAEGGRDMACRGLTFVTPDSAYHLIETSHNIAEVTQLLFPILVGRAPPFEQTLHWLQFSYTADRTGDYMASASTVLVPSAVLEGDPLFTAFWRHPLRRFPGVYAPTPTTHAPLGPD